jgi:uncharacterized membrane protein (UPF0127 family)
LPLPENPTYAVHNITRGTTVATRVVIAGTSAERRRGLLNTKSMQPGGGLWIAPCEAIHTVGMPWPIDVVFLDRNRRVLKIVTELLPWRIAVCLRSFSVLELPAGVLPPTRTEIDDILAFPLSAN